MPESGIKYHVVAVNELHSECRSWDILSDAILIKNNFFNTVDDLVYCHAADFVYATDNYGGTLVLKNRDGPNGIVT